MDFLKRNHVHWTTPVLLVAIAMACVGCMLFSPGEDDKPLAFSHAVHAKASVECADCHAGITHSDEPGMPLASQCLLCHKEIDASKPPEKHASNLIVDGNVVAMHASKLDPEVVFSHKRHVVAGQTCESCHIGIGASARIEPEMRVTMDTCTECHIANAKPNECATCHREIKKEWEPPGHAHSWTKMHGQAVRFPTGEMNDRCSLCHTESTCTTCHAETPPENHNNFWRIKGHGLAAEMDRAGCAVCHRSDGCDRCHAETMPLSHTGSFGGTRSNHCVSCHFPLADNSCVICHKGTPSHQLATPLPSDHTPAMNCRQCHGVTQPLPHADNGSSCTMCHM